MAKLNVIGDILQLKSDITVKEMELIQNYAPSALNLTDEEGNVLFAISSGPASISKYGVSFPSSDAEGHLFVTIENTGDHSDMEAEKASIRREYTPILTKLIVIEKNIEAAIEKMNTLETSVEELINFI